MMRINFNREARLQAKERRERDKHFKFILTRTPLLLAAIVAAGIGIRKCVPERVDVNPDVCKNIPGLIWGNDDGRWLAEERARLRCPPHEELERLVQENEKRAYSYLKCAELDRHAGLGPGPAVYAKAMQVLWDAGSHPMTVRSAIGVASSRKNSDVEEAIVYVIGINSIENDSAMRQMEEAAKALRRARAAGRRPSLDEMRMLGPGGAGGMRAFDQNIQLRSYAAAYSMQHYGSYENPFVAKLRYAYQAAGQECVKRDIYNVLLTIRLAYLGRGGSDRIGISLFSTGGRRMNFDTLTACEFQAHIGYAMDAVPGAVRALANEETARVVGERLNTLETAVVMEKGDWRRFMPSWLGGMALNGILVRIDGRMHMAVHTYRTGVHEMLHYVAHGSTMDPFGYLQSPILYEWLTEMLARQIVLQQLGLDSGARIVGGRAQWNGLYIEGSYKDYVDNRDFLGLYALFQQRLGFDGIMRAYMYSDPSPLRRAMDERYGGGAFDYVFNAGGFLDTLENIGVHGSRFMTGNQNSEEVASDAQARLREVMGL